MNCRQTFEKIEDFREGALDSAAENELRDHLGACKRCRQYLGRLDKLDRELKQVFGGMMPRPGFPARVVASLDSRESAVASGRTGPSTGLILAYPIKAALLVAASLLIAFTFWMTMIYRDMARETRRQEERIAMKEALFYQPDANAPLALGSAFVIGPEAKPTRSEKVGTIRITKMERGIPLLVVEAFPAEPAGVRQGSGPSS